MNTNKLKLNMTILSNENLKAMKDEEINILSKNFFLFSKANLEEYSKWIFTYHDEFKAENIIGFMELKRYAISEGATLSDKSPILFDIFKEEEYINYEDDNGFKSDRFSRLDTFILINNVEVLEKYRFQGIGSSIYKYLEENILTSEDSVVETTRTIQGRRCNLLFKIEKVPVFTDIVELYEGL